MGYLSKNVEARTGNPRRVAAFISYSHADADAAARLQRKLEHYRLPKHIAEARANNAAALGPIFRDREDLAAAASLSTAIRDAIATADALIVLCSPEAAKSQWVTAEIELFRELHPEGPILAALLSGEPAISFPAKLTENGNEPLAADLRPDGDGAQLGFLKIVAGIAGVPLDALIQRDAQRRIRRVTAITGGAIAAMLIMGIMTALALQARNDAARQRASAEGLVEYMLTDLRQKLKGVGRIDVMDAVNERAMQHYSSQAELASLPPDSLERRARILHAMGEDDNNSGKLDAALAKFREAHRATEALLKREPSNPNRIFAHAQSEYWVGQAAWNKRDRVITQRHWDSYVRLATKLIEVDPNQSRANLEMGYAFGNLCDLYLYGNYDLNKAIDFCRKSIANEQKALKLAPDNLEISMALANRYGWLADAQLAAMNFEAARQARLQEQAIVDRLLTGDPDNFELRFRQTWPKLGLASIAVAQGQIRRGAEMLAQVADEMAALNRLAPGNLQLNRALAKAWLFRAEALTAIDGIAALSALKRSQQVIAEYEDRFGRQTPFDGFRKRFDKLEEEIAG